MKQIEGYENYCVTEDGKVINTKTNRVLKLLTVTKNKYKAVRLPNQDGIKMLYVHRLVAKAYIPNPENKPQVNHKDMNKFNNCVANLEWCTSAENNRHAAKNMSEETRQKLSIASKGRVPWNKGIPRTEETKRKLSEARKGKTHSIESRRKMSESSKGKLKSAEHRLNISKGRKAYLEAKRQLEN